MAGVWEEDPCCIKTETSRRLCDTHEDLDPLSPFPESGAYAAIHWRMDSGGSGGRNGATGPVTYRRNRTPNREKKSRLFCSNTKRKRKKENVITWDWPRKISSKKCEKKENPKKKPIKYPCGVRCGSWVPSFLADCDSIFVYFRDYFAFRRSFFF